MIVLFVCILHYGSRRVHLTLNFSPILNNYKQTTIIDTNMLIELMHIVMLMHVLFLTGIT